ncbi:hypothetical protein [Pontibacter beigongshangensis]|uniref:hypothetical protein n=1 Tax=Pontibacter beigongshangensis TaxID=2574733 RepID=UPI00164FABF9|nr:hypothetical protein [Pontibacter beigongshangensis]
MARDYQRNYNEGDYGSHNSQYGSGRGERERHEEEKGFFGRIGDKISNAWERIAGDDDENQHDQSGNRSYGRSDARDYDRGGYEASSGSAGYGSSQRSHSPSTDYSSGYTGLYNREASGAGYGITGQTAWGGYGGKSSNAGNYQPGNSNNRRDSGYGRHFMDSDYGSSAGRGSEGRSGYGSGSMSGYSGAGFGGSNYSSRGGFGGSSAYGSMSGGYSSGDSMEFNSMDYRPAGASGMGSSSGYGAGSWGGQGSSAGYAPQDQHRSGGSGSMGGGAFGSGAGSFSGGYYGETGSMGGARQSYQDRGWTSGGYTGSAMRSGGLYGSDYSDEDRSGLTDWAGQSLSLTEGDYGSPDLDNRPHNRTGTGWENRHGSHNYPSSHGEQDRW